MKQLFFIGAGKMATAIAAGLVFAGLTTILCAVLQALGAAGESLLLSLLRQVVLILPAAWLLVRLLPSCTFLAFLAAECVTTLVAVALYRRVSREKLQ